MSEVFEVVVHQLKNNFFLLDEEEKILKYVIDDAKRLTINSIKVFTNKYFHGDIHPYNSVMWCMFLYWLSKSVQNANGGVLADKVYYLNKVMNAVDLYYEIELPEHWTCEHPLGSVMGRAQYGDKFIFMQGCTVGGNWTNGELKYPIIGEQVTMLSNSKIIGDSHIGNNVTLSANSYVINRDIPDNSVVFGQGKDIVIKEKKDSD